MECGGERPKDYDEREPGQRVARYSPDHNGELGRAFLVGPRELNRPGTSYAKAMTRGVAAMGSGRRQP